MKKDYSKNDKSLIETNRLEDLYKNIKNVIDTARETVYKTANFETVKANWLIGQYIVEEEQHGKERASKGDALLKKLSEKLTLEYASGFDSTNLKRMRKFYLTFPKGATQIFASKYKLYLPTEEELKHKLELISDL